MLFKDTNNQLHDIDPDFVHLLPEGCVEVTIEEADAIRVEHQAKAEAERLASLTYKDLRAAEYPPMADYLDAVVKGDLVQQQAYIDACLAIKQKYPKPEVI